VDRGRKHTGAAQLAGAIVAGVAQAVVYRITGRGCRVAVDWALVTFTFARHVLKGVQGARWRSQPQETSCGCKLNNLDSLHLQREDVRTFAGAAVYAFVAELAQAAFGPDGAGYERERVGRARCTLGERASTAGT